MGEKRVNLTSEAKFVAEASRENPKLGWLEFVLTDDKPNDNKQGIKKEGFASLVDTGKLTPIKMASGKIKDDHSDATPFGVISELEAKESQVDGKAAIWKAERGSDYEMLKAMSAKGDPINVSWEIVYVDSEVDDAGIEWISDPVLTAATIVGVPAYGGRTPVVSVASVSSGDDDGDGDDGDDDDGDEKAKKAEAKLEKRMSELEKELKVLRDYKEAREKEDSDDELLASRLVQFTDAGFEFSDEDIKAKRETWLEIPDRAFEGMLEMMKSVRKASASVPDVSGTPSADTIEVVRQGLKKMREATLEEN